jgi:hypothetical protein
MSVPCATFPAPPIGPDQSLGPTVGHSSRVNLCAFPHRPGVAPGPGMGAEQDLFTVLAAMLVGLVEKVLAETPQMTTAGGGL